MSNRRKWYESAYGRNGNGRSHSGPAIRGVLEQDPRADQVGPNPKATLQLKFAVPENICNQITGRPRAYVSIAQIIFTAKGAPMRIVE